MPTQNLRALTFACLASLIASSAAHAIEDPNLMTYRSLHTSGGVVNPGVIVGFNPQPDPPGFPTLDLTNPFEPKLVQPDGPATFDFVMSINGLIGLLLPAVQKPNADGVTEFSIDWGDHKFDVALIFSGPGAIRDWASFNPQPEPPGVWFADAITFAGKGDPSVSFSMFEDGTRLSFSAPEPSTWAMMGLGFAALGVLAHRRTTQSPALASRA
jgi:hypothetical protein